MKLPQNEYVFDIGAIVAELESSSEGNLFPAVERGWRRRLRFLLETTLAAPLRILLQEEAHLPEKQGMIGIYEVVGDALRGDERQERFGEIALERGLIARYRDITRQRYQEARIMANRGASSPIDFRVTLAEHRDGRFSWVAVGAPEGVERRFPPERILRRGYEKNIATVDFRKA